ncbi:MAG: DUF1028 domain-containing protein [Crocinitomicaceae bacterium]
MKSILFMSLVLCLSSKVNAQDTFSIVAVDSVTGEVGSAGASCVDLFIVSVPGDDFLGQLIPGVGAINTQAYYLPANQTNATNQMNLGQTPSQIIQWLIANDIQGQPAFRQYGIAAMVNGSPEAAAHTGSSTDDFKNHIVGPNYAIQGNILLGQEVLDSMEARFLNEEGDLACKLMAALQGANMIGADTRCAPNGTSSLFAFVKVAQPTDTFGSPSFLESVRTSGGAGIEPIDSLQIKFDLAHPCGSASTEELMFNEEALKISPNPTSDYITIDLKNGSVEACEYEVLNVNGQQVVSRSKLTSSKIDFSKLDVGIYFVRIHSPKETYVREVIKM